MKINFIHSYHEWGVIHIRNGVVSGVKKIAIELICLIYFRWYHVNYRMAEALQYGFGKGCDFAEKSCKEFMQIKKKALVFPFQVSYSISNYGNDSLDEKINNFVWHLYIKTYMF